MIRILRLLLLAALMLAPAGRIGMAEAAAAPAAAASGHCADMPRHAPAPAGHEGAAIDCMIACAALAAIPAPFVAPMAVAADPLPIAACFPDPAGISPAAEPRPPRFS